MDDELQPSTIDKPLTEEERLWNEYYCGPGRFEMQATNKYFGMGYEKGSRIRNQQSSIAYREQLCQRVADRFNLNSQRWVGELLALAFSDPTETLNDEGLPMTGKELKNLPPQIRVAIKEMKAGADGTVTVKMHSKDACLRMLGEYMHVLKSRGLSPAGDPPPTVGEEEHEDGLLLGLQMIGPGFKPKPKDDDK